MRELTPVSMSLGCKCKLEMKIPTACDRFASNNLATFIARTQNNHVTISVIY